jgi:hypothetical protein
VLSVASRLLTFFNVTENELLREKINSKIRSLMNYIRLVLRR